MQFSSEVAAEYEGLVSYPAYSHVVKKRFTDREPAWLATSSISNVGNNFGFRGRACTYARPNPTRVIFLVSERSNMNVF